MSYARCREACQCTLHGVWSDMWVACRRPLVVSPPQLTATAGGERGSRSAIGRLTAVTSSVSARRPARWRVPSLCTDVAPRRVLFALGCREGTGEGRLGGNWEVVVLRSSTPSPQSSAREKPTAMTPVTGHDLRRTASRRQPRSTFARAAAADRTDGSFSESGECSSDVRCYFCTLM